MSAGPGPQSHIKISKIICTKSKQKIKTLHPVQSNSVSMNCNCALRNCLKPGMITSYSTATDCNLNKNWYYIRGWTENPDFPILNLTSAMKSLDKSFPFQSQRSSSILQTILLALQGCCKDYVKIIHSSSILLFFCLQVLKGQKPGKTQNIVKTPSRCSQFIPVRKPPHQLVLVQLLFYSGLYPKGKFTHAR